jgi:hypothetical protein
MKVVRERVGEFASFECSVEHARYDEASSRSAERLDRKERYWGSLLSYLISHAHLKGILVYHFPAEHPSVR